MFKWFRKFGIFNPVYRVEKNQERFIVMYLGRVVPEHIGTRNTLEEAKSLVAGHKAIMKKETVWEE
jgi:hypothetical protein